MKRVNISLTDETYEALRKLAFDCNTMPGTLAAKIVTVSVEELSNPERDQK
jgi:hypothetical protein